MGVAVVSNIALIRARIRLHDSGSRNGYPARSNRDRNSLSATEQSVNTETISPLATGIGSGSSVVGVAMSGDFMTVTGQGSLLQGVDSGRAAPMRTSPIRAILHFDLWMSEQAHRYRAARPHHAPAAQGAHVMTLGAFYCDTVTTRARLDGR